jgi:hypothetical protein
MTPPGASSDIGSHQEDERAPAVAAPLTLPDSSQGSHPVEPPDLDGKDALAEERRIARSLARLISNEN